MFDPDTLATWKRAAEGGAPLGRAELERALRPAARRSGRALGATLLLYLVMPLATCVLAATNVSLFPESSEMVALELSLCLLAAGSAGHSLWLLLRLRAEDPSRWPLVESLERRLRLYERSAGAWMLTASFTPWLLVMAINTRIDAVDGAWHVNRPVEFVVVSAVTVVITWVGLRISLRSPVFEMRAALQDLLAEALEATPRAAELRRRTRVWMVLLFVALTASVLAGLWLWWSYSGA